MYVIVDTNVPLVANLAAQQASPACVEICATRLRTIQQAGNLVLDDQWEILREYMANLRSSGQPGVGDGFLKWVLTNRTNPRRCTLVPITKTDASFAEFPCDLALAGFDHSDHKFVAVAVAQPEHPPILNATDPDWWDYRHVLKRHGVEVQFVCPDYPFDEVSR